MDKKRARLNCISHLLRQLPYQEVEHPKVVLPERVFHSVPAELIVPEVF